ncbi:hypothetical protein [Bradyrhizobium sp. USDA 4504]
MPFSDGAGEVLAVGPDVTRVKSGGRVCPNFFPTDRRWPRLVWAPAVRHLPLEFSAMSSSQMQSL